MKFSASLALIVFVGLVACSSALPARKRMAYYQQPSQRYWSRPQRLMYMQYVQPSHGTGRSAQAASALVAGESVATGTYLQENEYALGHGASFSGETQSNEDALSAAGAHSAHSVAEAYPDDQKISVNVNLDAADKDESYNDAKEAREYNYDAPADVEIRLPGQAAGADVDAGADAAQSGTVGVSYSGAAESAVPILSGGAKGGIGVSVNLPAPVPVAPKPAKRYLPSKKVFVELEQSAEAGESDADNAVAVLDDDDVDEDDNDLAPVPIVPKYPARVPNGRRPAAKKPAKGGCGDCSKSNCSGCAKAAKPQPTGVFFPVEFGGTTGGAIAIANSFSTGESGSATSHAIAYGTPDQARARLPARRRH